MVRAGTIGLILKIAYHRQARNVTLNVEKKRGAAIFWFFPAAVLGKLYKLESYYHMLYENLKTTKTETGTAIK